MANFDVKTGQPVHSSVNIEWAGEISDENAYHEIIDWDNGATTVESSEGDIITLTPELTKVLRRRLLKRAIKEETRQINQHISNILINLYTPSDEHKRRLNLRLTHPEFVRGLKAGTGEALYGEIAGTPATDVEFVTILKEFFDDPERTDESLYFSIGALIGQIITNS